jgi:hypothetical protein
MLSCHAPPALIHPYFSVTGTQMRIRVTALKAHTTHITDIRFSVGFIKKISPF